MSLINLPEIQASSQLQKIKFDCRSDALERHQPGIRAASGGDNVITIYDQIGEDWYGEGVTAKRIGAALRSIGDQDVVVNINSPGGDFFEGLGIYNLLRQHQHKVTVNIIGLAASAASIIAMAGDDILMSEGSFLMIHNAWSVVAGNRHDLQMASETLAPFDASMAEVYAARAGISKDDAATMMDRETWITAGQAIEDGFATGLMDAKQIDGSEESGKKRAMSLIESAMAKAGHSRSERRQVFKSLFENGTPSATGSTMPGASAELAASLQNLSNKFKGQ